MPSNNYTHLNVQNVDLTNRSKVLIIESLPNATISGDASHLETFFLYLSHIKDLYLLKQSDKLKYLMCNVEDVCTLELKNTIIFDFEEDIRFDDDFDESQVREFFKNNQIYYLQDERDKDIVKKIVLSKGVGVEEIITSNNLHRATIDKDIFEIILG